LVRRSNISSSTIIIKSRNTIDSLLEKISL
jgi:hypothetical protein